MTEPTSTGIPLQRLLRIRVGLLVACAVLLVAVGAFLLGIKPMVNRVAENQFALTAAKVEASLAAVFSPTEQVLRMSQGWIGDSAPDLESPDVFNRTFRPVLQALPQATSVVAGTSNGEGWMLLQLPDGKWRNRMTDRMHWGDRHIFFEHNVDGESKKTWKTLDYDPRKRSWYLAALGDKNQTHWTSPYTFFTTGDPGITASMRTTLKDGRDFVIGIDLMLRDLSATTMGARIGQHGMTLVLTQDLRILALPAAPPGIESAAWLGRILKPSNELGLVPLDNALLRWRLNPVDRVISFRSNNAAWLARIHAYPLGGQQLWVATLAPEADFTPDWLTVAGWLFVVLAGLLVLAMLFASHQARLIARPLEQLAAESKQIGQLDFDRPLQPATAIAEIDTLAGAFHRMRQLLHQNQLKEQQAQAEIHKLAFYDPLTHLANRRLLQERLRQALSASNRRQTTGALLFIDLDNFKTLNDTRGHDTGDQLLREVGHRLRESVRAEDFVARLGGDEFVILLENLDGSPTEAAALAESAAGKILEGIRQPYLLDNHEHHTTTSIGVCLFSTEGRESVEELLKRADAAMYRAKTAGGNTLRFFDPALQASLEKRAVMEAALRRALPLQQLELHFQPKVNGNRRVVGAEALLRWRDPEHGLIAPGQFIPLAEESGLIVPIGQWVIETACQQLRQWNALPGHENLCIAVNVSARQFLQPNFVATVTDILAASGVLPGNLTLELTESLVLDNVADSIEKMHAIKALGVGFSMDDFGTGYSSLAYLKRLPLDELKIDQSFVRDIATDPGDEVIVRTIIAMARSLGLSVVAEGVETQQQFDFLLKHQCELFQGYLFNHPLPKVQFEKLLAG
jgi:diguanylate cyclase (GGDEF)-like protein